MKIGAIIPVFKMNYFLPIVLKEIHWVDKILILKNHKAWDGEGMDDTNIQEDEKIEIADCEFEDQTEQRNCGLFLLRDFDFIFVLDSDEVLLKADQIMLLACAIQNPAITAFSIEVKAYKDMGHIYDYDTGHTPIVLVRGGTALRDIRCVPGAFGAYLDGFLHHLKFLQPPDKLEWRKTAKKHPREVKGVIEFIAPMELQELLDGWILHRTEIEKGELY